GRGLEHGVAARLAEAVDVRPRTGDDARQAAHLFGCGVIDRAGDAAADEGPRTGRPQPMPHGESEVDDLHLPAVTGMTDQYIRRLDVAVQDALGVRGLQSLRDLEEDLAEVVAAQSAAARRVLERLALEVIHHEVRTRPPVRAAEAAILDADDA